MNLHQEDTGNCADLSQRPNPEALVILFVPSLAATLHRAESDRGEALSEAEVLRMRDEAPLWRSPKHKPRN